MKMVEKVRFGFLGVAHFHSENYGRVIKELPNLSLIHI